MNALELIQQLEHQLSLQLSLARSRRSGQYVSDTSPTSDLLVAAVNNMAVQTLESVYLAVTAVRSNLESNPTHTQNR